MLGLVLEGGGIKGSFHMGALKALFEHGYKFDGVMGCSIGAFNGALVAQGDFNAGYQLWDTITPSSVMNVDDDMMTNIAEKKWNRNTIKYAIKLIRGTISNRGIPTDKLRTYLSKYVNEEKLRNSPTDFGVVTVSLTDDWLPIEIFKDEMPPGSLLDYIFASASFPAFKGEEIAGKRYIDGGIYDNLPVNPLIRKGYNHIIAIRTMSNMPRQKVIDASVTVDYICPSAPLGGTLAFSSNLLRHNLKMGYYDAMRYIKKLAGKTYYIEDLTDAQFVAYTNQAGVLPYKKISESLELSEREDATDILSSLCKKLNDHGIYADGEFGTFIDFLEPFATALSIERFEIYNFDTFLKKVLSQYVIFGKENLDQKVKLKTELKDVFHSIANAIITHGDLI
ncbi:MAG: patatin-like phospholipase family protein [Christensenellaceae bacterium]|jgi:NTE family protein|nr:patatin-like phospholipase family protein [Christensenellaceae bacterium]